MKTTLQPAQPLTSPSFEVPAGACNAHVHVMGPRDRFPLAAERPLTYGEAPVEELSQMLAKLRLDRVVIVQSIIYGTDNSGVVDAMKYLQGRARGIAVINAETPDSALADLQQAGIRGVRVVISKPEHAERIPALTSRIAALGWHLQIYGELPVLLASRKFLVDLPVPLVMDHFGGAKAADGPRHPDFLILLDLLRSENVYVKVSGLHRCSVKPDFSDMPPLVEAMDAIAPDRLVWGNDWPHPANVLSDTLSPSKDRLVPWADVDDGADFNLLPRWFPDKKALRRVLVDNPARLYGFPASVG